MNTQQTSALVIGGSIAGLLAARVLSDYVDTVTIIERDTLPESAEYRNGTPQAHHLHTLLAHGQRLFEQLFPNIEQDFEAQGAPLIHWGLDTVFRTTEGWIDQHDTNIHSHVLSRTTLEWVVRQRVMQLSNVTVMQQQQVNHLLTNTDQSAVIGVNVTSRSTKQSHDIYADLVVDTSGRGSKAMQWLQDLGYPTPKETVINSYLGYATRWYQLPDNVSYSWKTMLIQANPSKKLNRGGGAFIVEGNRLVVTLAGANKDYPSTDEAEFMAFAKSLASTDIYDIIKDLTPISSIYGYRRTENRFRHYEKLSKMPKGFIVIGDAVCGFNPIYGQGMTAAAIEAMELDNLLRVTDIHDLDGFSLTFQKRLAKAIDGAWIMATGEDLRYPETVGAKPNLMMRLTHRYLDSFGKAMIHDHILYTAFLRTMNLATHPTSLFQPHYVLRVLHHRIFERTASSSNESLTELTTIKSKIG